MSEDSNNTIAQPFQTLESHYLLKTPWRNFREDRLDIGSGREITYSYVETPPAVFVVPLTDDGRLILIRQYRYPVRDWVLEVPAGSLNSEQEDPQVSARRELLEEIGAECQELIQLTRFYSSSAHLNLASYIYLATGVRIDHEQALEETELIQRVVIPVEEALALAHRGEISEGQSAYSVLLAEPHILARKNQQWK